MSDLSKQAKTTEQIIIDAWYSKDVTETYKILWVPLEIAQKEITFAKLRANIVTEDYLKLEAKVALANEILWKNDKYRPKNHYLTKLREALK